MNCFQNRYYLTFLALIFITLSGCRKEKPSISKEEFAETKKQLVEVNKILVRKDRQLIQGFIQRHELNMNESGTGLWYSIIEKGNGAVAEEGKKATINFKISLMDGTECYNSDIEGVKTFTIGRGSVESGLEEGILLLNEGGKARFILPPHLAYGLSGDGSKIPPRAIIVFDVEVISID